jgi:uncharacterized lipoprotein YehR (DUF1307 family)
MTKKFLAVILALTMVFALVGCGGSSNDDKVLQETVNQLNEQCPMAVDSETRLDNTATFSGKILQYNYTLINYSKDALSEEQITETKNSLQSQILNTIKSSEEMETLRDMGVTFKYVYKSNDSFELFSLTFSPKDYQ